MSQELLEAQTIAKERRSLAESMMVQAVAAESRAKELEEAVVQVRTRAYQYVNLRCTIAAVLFMNRRKFVVAMCRCTLVNFRCCVLSL
eukprot:COSAG02_NODE_1683_length_11339_cov_976.310409_7_plen_88_part_00